MDVCCKLKLFQQSRSCFLTTHRKLSSPVDSFFVSLCFGDVKKNTRLTAHLNFEIKKKSFSSAGISKAHPQLLKMKTDKKKKNQNLGRFLFITNRYMQITRAKKTSIIQVIVQKKILLKAPAEKPLIGLAHSREPFSKEV